MNRAIRESMAPLEQCTLRCRTELENKTRLSIVYARLRYREEKSSMFCQVRTKNQNFELWLQTVGKGLLRAVDLIFVLIEIVLKCIFILMFWVRTWHDNNKSKELFPRTHFFDLDTANCYSSGLVWHFGSFFCQNISEILFETSVQVSRLSAFLVI